MGILIQSVDLVWVTGMDVDQAIDDQRTTFMTTQRTGGESPDGLNVFSVILVDLGQCAEPGTVVVAAPGSPVSGIMGEFFNFGIREADAGCGQS